jgi:hypothetical protein
MDCQIAGNKEKCACPNAECERAGLKAAEGFIQHRGDSYPQDNILKTILKKLCVEF